MEQADANSMHYPQHNGGVKRSNHVAINENDSSNESQPSSPHKDIPLYIEADTESLGGISGEFGSRSHLFVPACNGFNDADSGIHSAQGPTPVIPDHSYPSYEPTDPDSSDLKATKRHSITVVHHEHTVPIVDAANQQIKEEVIEVSTT